MRLARRGYRWPLGVRGFWFAFFNSLIPWSSKSCLRLMGPPWAGILLSRGGQGHLYPSLARSPFQDEAGGAFPLIPAFLTRQPALPLGPQFQM